MLIKRKHPREVGISKTGHFILYRTRDHFNSTSLHSHSRKNGKTLSRGSGEKLENMWNKEYE